jgi:predicted N-acyltransferase
MGAVKNNSNDYVIRVLDSPLEVAAREWNGLLAGQPQPTPFMRHEYLAAMDRSGSARPNTGWTPRFITLWRGDDLHAACALYLKAHSYGEYVFDWAWANAYEQHGLAYYPKALAAVPFTPVPGSRLLARDPAARQALVRAILAWASTHRQSSFHVLFAAPEDVAACEASGMMLRHTVQFHWTQRESQAWSSFDDFLSSLAQEKRKKIRQERRKVSEAGVTFRHSRGADIAATSAPIWNTATRRT